MSDFPPTVYGLIPHPESDSVVALALAEKLAHRWAELIDLTQ